MKIPEEWVLDQQIRELAYYKWQQAGSPSDMCVEFWLQAKSEVYQQYGIIE